MTCWWCVRVDTGGAATQKGDGGQPTRRRAAHHCLQVLGQRSDTWERVHIILEDVAEREIVISQDVPGVVAPEGRVLLEYCR